MLEAGRDAWFDNSKVLENARFTWEEVRRNFLNFYFHCPIRTLKFLCHLDELNRERKKYKDLCIIYSTFYILYFKLTLFTVAFPFAASEASSSEALRSSVVTLHSGDKSSYRTGV